ncbi:hypothetical protein HN873_020445 [Arachis hypogaea]
MFRVRLDNQDLTLGYVSGKIRKNFVRILPGDRVKVEELVPEVKSKRRLLCPFFTYHVWHLLLPSCL